MILIPFLVLQQKVGVEGADRFIDATTLKTDQDIASAIKNYNGVRTRAS